MARAFIPHEICAQETKSFTSDQEKNQFALKTMKILGHTWSNGKLLVEASWNLEPAKTKRGVRAILGLASYFHSYFLNLTEATHCINELLCKDKPDKAKRLPKPTAALEVIKQGLTSILFWQQETSRNRF